MTETTPQPKALIICGHPRSGTTLLNRRFDAHPEIFTTEEMRLFVHVGKSPSDYLANVRHDYWKRPLLPRGGHPPFRMLQRKVRSFIFWQGFSKKIRGLANRQTVSPEIVIHALNSLRPGKTFVGDKYPPYVYLLDELTLNPILRVVVIYRDVLDVVASRIRQFDVGFKRKPPPAGKIAGDWVNAISTMQRNAERVHILQYEAMVRDPQPYFDAMAEWLGIDPHGFKLNEIRDSSVGQTRRLLTDSQVSEILDVTGPTRAQLGYDND